MYQSTFDGFIVLEHTSTTMVDTIGVHDVRWGLIEATLADTHQTAHVTGITLFQRRVDRVYADCTDLHRPHVTAHISGEELADANDA